MASKKKQDKTNLIVWGVIALIGLAVVFAIVSENKKTESSTDARARASIPEKCTKPGKKGVISNLRGIVLSKDETEKTFIVDIGAPNAIRNRTVYSCTSTLWMRAKGGGSDPGDLYKMTFADLNVGDKVVVDGNFVDQDKTTIYPMRIQDMSLHPEHFRGDVTAKTAIELTLENVVNGPARTVAVLLTATNRCYRDIRFRDIKLKTPKVDCSTIAVGERVEVDGIYSDVKGTLIGPYAQLVVHPRD
ncbi:hypothetical protein A2875_03880 [Candidatus Gottesmanbacteria bacterium RIFCSPHIGHO2_01_FULL_46_14]|uniref:DUF5666 domain-containing protein n=2 Tax=Candidatus Gottesmaniibacteriota TaxID=1752720 RepID=A0A1F5ZNY8_9BACT|nr:MAG: hypothetical protein A2875_03880 [Candidatus Gottesmanbacteria bacterium RIFCSPHIGHO2_01_FULL_46_14]OGG29725.1 MAG: hypothetical protein A2971_00570 [Candidatus Gottesmanbacteria bacterium RIFCSPLOWO2_01_FULL_46_21]